MNDEKYIGVFDSGIGGLTVVKSIMDIMPDENIVYYGDTAHVPYGNRSKGQIINYVNDDILFLQKFNLKAIVIACNTADSIAREYAENKFDLPFFGVVEPASAEAAITTRNGKIGVIATNATVNSRAYENAIGRINKELTVISKACPLLVPLVENNRFKKNDSVIETVLNEYLEPLKAEKIDTLVLGCTHYPLLYDLISDIMPGTKIISSSVVAANALKKGMIELGIYGGNVSAQRKFYVSDNPELFGSKASTFLGSDMKVSVKHISEID